MTQMFALNFGRLGMGRIVRAGFIAWLFAEVFAFMAVSSAIGVGNAMLLGLASSAVGIVLLVRFGQEAALDLRSIMSGQLAHGRPSVIERTLTALAIALLIVPGFLSDIAGLALLFPPVRAWLAARISPKQGLGPQGGDEAFVRPRSPSQAEIIDLPAGEWRHIDEPR